MSFSTLIGFCSTLYLVWLFINTPPQITISTTNVGAPGIPGYKITSYVIQGVPFFWIFTSLVSLSAGHTYRSAKDRKSTRLNSSHGSISYAVFCLKKKKNLKDKYIAYPNTQLLNSHYI